MVNITEGLTPDQFVALLNGNFPSKDSISVSDTTGELITKFHSNYDYVKSIDSEVPAKSALFVGMSGAQYIAALNQNFVKIDSVSPYKEYEHIIPNHRGSEYGMLLDIYYEPSVIRLSNGNNLIGCISRGGTFSRENFNVIGVDGVYGDPNLVGYDESTDGTYDSHGKAVYIEKDSVIYCFHEALNGVSETNQDGHNSNIVCKKSEDGGETWVEISRIEAYLCYPKAFIIGSDIYLLARKNIGASVKYVALYKSTNNCVTWTALTDPYTGTDPYWAYNSIPKGSTSEINILITERKTIDVYTSWPSVCHIRSYDGITYYNTNRTWSKNVVTNGSVTRAEAIAHCLIGNYDPENDNYSAILNGAFIKNDKLYTLISYGQPSLADTPFGEITKVDFDSAKIYEGDVELLDVSALVNDLSYTGYSQDGFMRLLRNGETFDILFIDFVGGEVRLYNYNSGGLLSTKLLKIGTDNITIGNSTFNTTTRTGRILVMGKLTGTMIDLVNSYSDLIIFEPNV